MRSIADSPLIYRPAPGLPSVLHEDQAVLVVNKPAGLLSVPGRLPAHHDSALLRLQAVFGTLWVVHRLDMDTSGVMAFARTKEAAAHLGRQFERRTVRKDYEALVWGRPPSASGVIALPLRLDWPHRPRQLVDGVAGKSSTTHYQIVRLEGRGDSCTEDQAARTEEAATGIQSRLKLTPITGRSHQLRVHCSAVGLPIIGDRFYGRAPEAEKPPAARLMLHARHLTIQHPSGEHLIEVEAPPGF